MQENHTIAILAFNNHQLTIKNIEELIGDNNKILIFDNGSTPSYEQQIKKYNVSYYRENKNIYVNPAWNKIFDLVKTKYLTLLNNDCYILSNNYFNNIIKHMDKYDIALSSCKTINKKSFNINKLFYYKYYYNCFSRSKLKYASRARRQGWLMTLNLDAYKQMNYKIPDYLKVWFGDDWIWSQIANNNKKYAIYKNRYALHIRNQTVQDEEIKKVINLDKNMMNKKGIWVNKKIHCKSRLFNRYI